MICPKCGSDSRVKDSRQTNDAVRRRRRCTACGYRFTSYEVPVLDTRYDLVVEIARRWRFGGNQPRLDSSTSLRVLQSARYTPDPAAGDPRM